MRRAVLALVSVTLAACRAGDGPAQPAQAPTPAPAPLATIDDDACSIRTPLKPGVPGSPGNLLPSPINPNGVSELAALMRVMLEDVRAARAAVVEGRDPPTLGARHHKLRCSWPTQEHMRNAEFDALARAYLQAEGALDARNPDARTAYKGLVRACIACHQVSCEGPIPLIEELVLTE